MNAVFLQERTSDESRVLESRMMKKWFVIAAVIVIGSLVWGLSAASLAPGPRDDRASFAGVQLHLLFATTTATRELGLGKRDYLLPDDAMLFVFSRDDRYGFWMKDTMIPLDMFWLDAQGHVVFMQKDVSPSTYPAVFYPSVPARYVLETNAGFAKAHDVTVGTPLLLQKMPIVSE